MQYPLVTLDAEGRLTLTYADRQRLGLRAGDSVEFWVAEDGLVLRKAQLQGDGGGDDGGDGGGGGAAPEAMPQA